MRAITKQHRSPYDEYNIKFDYSIIVPVCKRNLRPTVHNNIPPSLAAIVNTCWDADPGTTR